MASSAHNAYLEGRILAADPLELVCILYRSALESVREARNQLANGDIAARSKAISRAAEAVMELNSSLNHEAGGEMSRRLCALYEYIQGRLFQANFEQDEGPLIEVAGLLATLLEAWQFVGAGAIRREPSTYEESLAGVPPEDVCAGRVSACA